MPNFSILKKPTAGTAITRKNGRLVVPDERQVEVPAAHQFQQVGRARLHHVDLHSRVAGAELGDSAS